MINGRMPLYLTVLAALASVAALLVFQPYSADHSVYARPAQRYISAALRQDSIGLSRLSATAVSVVWALEVARNHRDRLASWATHTQAFSGERRGDTAEVFLYPDRDPCSTTPIVLRFVGSGSKARVLSANSACFASK